MVEMGERDSYTPPPSKTGVGESDAPGVAARLSSERRRRVYEPAPDRIFPAEAAALARRAPVRFVGYVAPPEGREPAETGFDRPCIAGDRAGYRVAHPRPRAQADLENRLRAVANRYRHLRLLRGNRSADRHPAARGAADRDLDDRGAGAA